MNRPIVICVAAWVGISLVSAHAATSQAFSSQPAPAPVQQSKQKLKPVTPPAKSKSPPSKPDTANCNKPCNQPSQATCPTVIIYPYAAYYSYPVYSYSAYDSSASYSSSRATYRSDGRAQANDAIESYDISYEDDYWKRGRNWGQDLRRDVVDFDDFVAFVAQEIASAPESLRLQFQKGFAEGYGQSADKAFQKALDLAMKERAKAEQAAPEIK